MADDLGLSGLTNDQLIQLGAALATEIMSRRDTALADALREVVAGARSAGENAASLAAQASARARDEVAGWSDWSLARRAAMMIAETLGPDWSFAVWRSPETRERRVYLDAPRERRISEVRRRHRGDDGARTGKVTYLVDGDRRRPPGTLDCEGVAAAASPARILAIVRFIAACWDERPGIPAARALAATVEPAPLPSYY